MIIRTGTPFANDHPDFVLSTRLFSIFLFIFSKFLILSSSPSTFFFFFQILGSRFNLADLSRTICSYWPWRCSPAQEAVGLRATMWKTSSSSPQTRAVLPSHRSKGSSHCNLRETHFVFYQRPAPQMEIKCTCKQQKQRLLHTASWSDNSHRDTGLKGEKKKQSTPSWFVRKPVKYQHLLLCWEKISFFLKKASS